MADTKLTALSSASAIVGADLFYIVQSSASLQATGTQLKTWTSASPTLVTPNLGTPSAGILTNTTGLPVSTGISGLGTGVSTALAVNVGSAGAFVVLGGALGTPSSGTLTNATGLLATGGGTGQSTYTKGDLLASPGSNTLNKLGVGTDGQILTADTASTNGVKWAAAAGGSLTIGTTSISSGTTTRILYDNAGTLGEYTLSGTGTVVVMQTSPALVTPALGVATGTSLAIGGATIGSNALAVTGTVLLNSAVSMSNDVNITGTGKFLQLSNTGGIFWANRSTITSSADGTIVLSDNAVSKSVSITTAAAATLQQGAADAASPVAQTTRVQSVVAGTSNTAGADWTFSGSVGTGTGAGGSILFKTAAAGSTGTSQNTLATILTLSGTTGQIIGPAGTASQAAFILGSASGDGWYSPGSGQFAWTSSTTARFRFSSTQFGVSSSSRISFGDNTDVTAGSYDTFILRGGASATLQFGVADAASPVAQSTTVQSVVAGTTNTAGADWTFKGSKGTGTGAGGSIIFQTAAAGSSGTSQNTLATAFTVKLGTAVLASYTVATLPAAATVGAGATAFVTDASTTLILGLGGTVTGGGSNKVPVYSDGTNWIYG